VKQSSGKPNKQIKESTYDSRPQSKPADLFVGLALLSACGPGGETVSSATATADRAANNAAEQDLAAATAAPVDTVVAGTPTPTENPDALQEKYAEYEIVNLLPRDAIPSIDDPLFISSAEADISYDPDELIIGIEFNEQPRAYSVPLLSNHEIVNDEIDGIHFAVTW
jgi:hypothetical protein